VISRYNMADEIPKQVMKFKYRVDGPAIQGSGMKPRMLPAELPNLLHWFDSHQRQTFLFGTGSRLQGLVAV